MIGREAATLTEHLRELRYRLIVSVLALLVGSVVAFPFWERIIVFLVLPAPDVKLIAIEVTETLTTSVKVSFLAGFFLASPVIIYQAIRFIVPGLTGREKLYLLIFVPSAMMAFAAGVVFAYLVLAPAALGFLTKFGSGIIEIQPRVSNIVDLMVRFLVAMGIAFETPLIMYLLAQMGLVSVRAFSRFRRYWLIIAFLLAAIITPTIDPFNQALVAGPLLVLYEVGILLARIGSRGRQRSREAITPVSPAE